MKYFFSALLVLLALPKPVYSCASCGSGGDDPLILYPNEIWKAYLGFTYVSGFELIDHEGEVGTELGPDTKKQALLSVGRQITSASFITASIPFISNSREKRVKNGFGDPLLSLRYSLIQQNIAEEAIPQLQVLASYRKGVSRSIHGSRDPDLLDVFGSGYTQARIGLDLWSGLTRIQYGAAYVFGLSESKEFYGHRIQPGLESRATFSLGQSFAGVGKYVFGINRYEVRNLRDDGDEIKDSNQLNHSLFVTGDLFMLGDGIWRISLSKQAAVLNNKNTTRSNSVSLAYMRGF